MLSKFAGPVLAQKFPPTVGDGRRETAGPQSGSGHCRPNVICRKRDGPVSAVYDFGFDKYAVGLVQK